MGCFAMVCGTEQQNVIRRKQELKGKGNLRKNKLNSFPVGMLNTGYGVLLEIK